MATQQKQIKSNVDGDPSSNVQVVESELWEMANTLRGSMNTAEYKHIILGLIFLKYISDTSENAHTRLKNASDADQEELDGDHTQNIFRVPQDARWLNIQKRACQSTIGQIVDEVIVAVEGANPVLKDALPKNYARATLDNIRLGQTIDFISNIKVDDEKVGSNNVLGRVYEYFLSRFTSIEGKKGGEFYTPRSVVRLLVEMIQPYNGRVYDPCCGSAGMFVQSTELDHTHATGNCNWNGNSSQKTKADRTIYGQESDYTTWQLAKMNLAIHGIDSSHMIHGDSFYNDRHSDLRADFILANPPFNASEWGGDSLQNDQRWQYGIPPKNNANFAWVQHMIHHLAPAGIAGFVLSNSSMSSNHSGEGDVRRHLLETNMVDCIVALPGQLFYSSQIPTCLWFLTKGRIKKKRCNHTLFIDARRMGHMIDNIHRELAHDDMYGIANTYHSWCDDGIGKDASKYIDIPGFCKSVTLDDIYKHDYILTPGHYVGDESQQDGIKSFEEKVPSLVPQCREQQADTTNLDTTIRKNMKNTGFEIKSDKI